MKLKANDRVSPKTPAGLQLSLEAFDGTDTQKLTTSCVFIGAGTILETRDIVIDYDTWTPLYEGLGKVPYRMCLVICDAGIGWAGEGALIKAIR